MVAQRGLVGVVLAGWQWQAVVVGMDSSRGSGGHAEALFGLQRHSACTAVLLGWEWGGGCAAVLVRRQWGLSGGEG
jgi:hypothetical protein